MHYPSAESSVLSAHVSRFAAQRVFLTFSLQQAPSNKQQTVLGRFHHRSGCLTTLLLAAKCYSMDAKHRIMVANICMFHVWGKNSVDKHNVPWQSTDHDEWAIIIFASHHLLILIAINHHLWESSTTLDHEPSLTSVNHVVSSSVFTNYQNLSSTIIKSTLFSVLRSAKSEQPTWTTCLSEPPKHPKRLPKEWNQPIISYHQPSFSIINHH